MADIDAASTLVRLAPKTGRPVKYRVTEANGTSYLVTVEPEVGQTKVAVLAEHRMHSVSPTGSGKTCGCCGGSGQS
jgi:hypothetical protein